MVCPYYKDFTRECITKFPDFLEFPTFDFCASDDYKNCIAYLIFTSEFTCPYLTTCGNAYKKTIPKIITKMLGEKEIREIFYQYSVEYCISQENHTKCAKYKLLADGITPPINLFPDGKKIDPMVLLRKRKLMIHHPE